MTRAKKGPPPALTGLEVEALNATVNWWLKSKTFKDKSGELMMASLTLDEAMRRLLAKEAKKR